MRAAAKAASLSLLLVLPYLTKLSRRRTEDIGAGDVGVIAVDQGAGVDQHHVVDLQRPVALAAVGQAGVVAERDQAEPRAALPAQGAVLGVDEALDLGGQDAGLQPVARAALNLQGDGLGPDQKRDLGWRLDAPQGHDQRTAVHHAVCAQGLAQAQPDEGRRLIVHRQLAVRRHAGRGQGVGALFLFPGRGSRPRTAFGADVSPPILSNSNRGQMYSSRPSAWIRAPVRRSDGCQSRPVK